MFKILTFQHVINIKQIINEFLIFVLNVHNLVCILDLGHISVCTRHMFLAATELDSAAVEKGFPNVFKSQHMSETIMLVRSPGVNSWPWLRPEAIGQVSQCSPTLPNPLTGWTICISGKGILSGGFSPISPWSWSWMPLSSGSCWGWGINFWAHTSPAAIHGLGSSVLELPSFCCLSSFTSLHHFTAFCWAPQPALWLHKQQVRPVVLKVQFSGWQHQHHLNLGRDENSWILLAQTYWIRSSRGRTQPSVFKKPSKWPWCSLGTKVIIITSTTILSIHWVLFVAIHLLDGLQAILWCHNQPHVTEEETEA